MKLSIGHNSLLKISQLFVFVVCTIIVADAFAQDNGTTGAGTATCSNPPCGGSAVSCGDKPCPQDNSVVTPRRGGRQRQIPLMTSERAALKEQEQRYEELLADLDADESLAQQSETAGDSANAAFWRAHFAKKSSLTPEEADAVKKIAFQYMKDRITLNAQCYADLKAMKPTFKAEHDAGEKYSPVPSCEEFRALFPKMMADLLTTLGSKSFSRLDGYTRHIHDNARVLYNSQNQTSSTREQAAPQTPQK